MPEGAIRSRASEPLERQVELFKRRLPSWLQLWVPFAAKVSVVPCCSVRFGTAERERAELIICEDTKFCGVVSAAQPCYGSEIGQRP